jgi:hypothetical protein
MSHLVFNSVPRSGQVFLSKVAGAAFYRQISTVHLPEIFSVKELCHISIFRKPADAIASLLNKLREHSTFLEKDGKLDIEFTVMQAINTYDMYIDSVSKNLDNVHVVLFEDMTKNYHATIDSISKRFSLPINNNYQERISLDQDSPIWADKYDGHMPRDKDEIRLRIEEQVSLMDSIHLLTERYQAFLAKI